MAFGKRLESIQNIKNMLQKGASGGSGSQWIKYVPRDGSLNVRFVEDPEEWFLYYEHYDKIAKRSFPCTTERDSCPGCVGGMDSSTRYLANALDVDENKVIPLQMPKTLVNRLIVRYEKRGTLLDVDYELMRSGSGKDTMYDLETGSTAKRRMDQHEPLDLIKILEESYANYIAEFGDPDESPAPRDEAPKKRVIKPEPVEEADDTEDDGPDETDESPDFSEDQLNEMSLGQLRIYAREVGVAPSGKSKEELVAAIVAAGDAAPY